MKINAKDVKKNDKQAQHNKHGYYRYKSKA